MPKIKTSELAGSLSPHEIKLFERYMMSPFFSCSDEVVKLFDCISRDPGMNKEKLHAHIFPGISYNDKKLRYIISDLNKHIENFLLLRQLEKENLQSVIFKSKAVSLRNCDKSYSLLHKEIISNNTFQNAMHHLKQYEHAELHLNYINRDISRKTTPDYSQTLHHLDAFYIIKKLQLACEVSNLANILKTQYDIILLNEIGTIAQSKPFCDIPLVTIYYNILQTLTNSNSDAHFQIAEELLKQEGNAIHPAELFELYQYIRNYCVRKINQGNTEYVRMLFNIHNDMLNNKTLMKHDYLSQWEYKNIVTISLRLGEVKWCEQFIKRYINYLKPAERKNALAYNSAYFYFMNNEFHKAIRKLQEVELTDVFYQLDSRVVVLKSYYELDEFDAFFYQASAFRLFLLRNKGISEYQKTIYRNLIKYLTAIMRSGHSKVKLKRIRVEIEKEKNVADLNYLINKIDILL